MWFNFLFWDLKNFLLFLHDQLAPLLPKFEKKKSPLASQAFKRLSTKWLRKDYVILPLRDAGISISITRLNLDIIKIYSLVFFYKFLYCWVILKNSYILNCFQWHPVAPLNALKKMMNIRYMFKRHREWWIWQIPWCKMYIFRASYHKWSGINSICH